MHNWDDFRFFFAVARHGSYSVAAKELGVNHSTVSRRIQILEERHGVRLFERTRTGYTLTEAGSSIFEVIEQVNDSTLKASRVLLGQDSRLEGRIKLTMPHDLFECCMAEPLKKFCDQYPEISLELSVTHGLRDLANREADIAVRFTPNPPEYAVGTRITRIQHGIYGHKTIKFEKQTPIVIWGGDKALPKWASENFYNPYIALQVDDLASVHAAVVAGFGYARMPCFYPDSVNHDLVQRLPISQPLSSWGAWLLSHVDLRNTARINACKAYLKEALIESIPLFTGQLSSQSEVSAKVT